MAKNEYLEKAFQEAVASLNIGSLKPEDAVEAVVTGMHAYADKHDIKFDREEAIEKAVAGIKELVGAGFDFSFQNWAMK